jgi:hypothetical protein
VHSSRGKKNSNVNLDEYKQLRRLLEYCDLRELQDTILSKGLWRQFEKRFGNKETLSTRFGATCGTPKRYSPVSVGRRVHGQGG